VTVRNLRAQGRSPCPRRTRAGGGRARQADSAIARAGRIAEAQRAGGEPGDRRDAPQAQLATAQGLLLVAKNQLDRGRIDVTRARDRTRTPLTSGFVAAVARRRRRARAGLGGRRPLVNRPELLASGARCAARQTGSAIRVNACRDWSSRRLRRERQTVRRESARATSAVQVRYDSGRLSAGSAVSTRGPGGTRSQVRRRATARQIAAEGRRAARSGSLKRNSWWPRAACGLEMSSARARAL